MTLDIDELEATSGFPTDIYKLLMDCKTDDK